MTGNQEERTYPQCDVKPCSCLNTTPLKFLIPLFPRHFMYIVKSDHRRQCFCSWLREITSKWARAIHFFFFLRIVLQGQNLKNSADGSTCLKVVFVHHRNRRNLRRQSFTWKVCILWERPVLLLWSADAWFLSVRILFPNGTTYPTFFSWNPSLFFVLCHAFKIDSTHCLL